MSRRDLGDLYSVPTAVLGPQRERSKPKSMTNGIKKSDGVIVPLKATNKRERFPAESLEGRTPTKRNSGSQSTGALSGGKTVSQAAERIRKAVERNPKERLTALHHHITTEALKAAFHSLRVNAAVGVDGVTWRDYAEKLEDNIIDLHRRVQSGAYRAQPVRRVNIDKPDGGKRPLGIPALEDKIVQKAVVEVILTPIYEAEFLGFSYGFRPGRSAHDALDAVAFGITRRSISWIVDADVKAYFDTVSRDWLIKFLKHRIGDTRLIRLITKWLNAGVMDEGILVDTGKGTPQGAICTPRTQWQLFRDWHNVSNYDFARLNIHLNFFH